MRTTLTAMAVALLFAATASAQTTTIHTTDFEGETAGFGAAPTSMGFTDAGGDLIGFSANANPETSGLAIGISATNPNAGTFSYAVDTSQTVAGNGTANGWGGSWSGQDSNGGSGGFTNQATAEANGAGCYVDYTEGATFTASAQIATDAGDALTGSGTAAVRLEFHYGIDNNGDGVADFTSELSNLARAGGNGFDENTLTAAYQTTTVTYALTAADVDFANIAAGNPNGADGVAGTADDEIAVGFDRVVAVMGTDNNGHNPGTNGGMVFYDDFSFEVNSDNVVLVGGGHAVPEPGSAALLLAGLLGFCGVRRKKS